MDRSGASARKNDDDDIVEIWSPGNDIVEVRSSSSSSSDDSYDSPARKLQRLEWEKDFEHIPIIRPPPVIRVQKDIPEDTVIRVGDVIEYSNAMTNHQLTQGRIIKISVLPPYISLYTGEIIREKPYCLRLDGNVPIQDDEQIKLVMHNGKPFDKEVGYYPLYAFKCEVGELSKEEKKKYVGFVEEGYLGITASAEKGLLEMLKEQVKDNEEMLKEFDEQDKEYADLDTEEGKTNLMFLDVPRCSNCGKKKRGDITT